MVGTTLSHYRIERELGRGGMGVVYLAEDLRLGRRVAVKVLPRHAVGVGDEAARFGREARAAAALNHPHIATVHEIDEAEGQPFIVMEYVDGPSLKDRIREGPLPLDETVRLAIQVAGGLAAAHERGIVHRDMKPANVMLTLKGDARIMDFGLAQLTDATQLTQTGTTLGTVTYMSPEQARGDKVDARSDIFSLGVVIYEMVIGQPAFRGSYAEAIVYSILNEDPQPMTALRTGVPMELERIVGKCLAKEAPERYQGMQDVLVDLRALEKTLPDPVHGDLGGTRRTQGTRTQHETAMWMSRVPWAIAASSLAVAVAVPMLGGRDDSDAPPAPFSINYRIPDGYVLTPGEQGGKGSGIALSRDGGQLAFIAYRDNVSRLFLKGPGDREAYAIPESDGADNPFFSPDGEWLGFTQDNQSIMKVSTRGGRPVQIAQELPWVFGADWSEDDRIMIRQGFFRGLQSISVDGGRRDSLPQARPLSEVIWPEVIPESQQALVSTFAGNQPNRVALLDLKSGEVTPLFNDAVMGRRLGNRGVLFVQNGSLRYTDFDFDTATPLGSAQLVATDIATHKMAGYATPSFSVADNGTIAMVRGADLAGMGFRIVRIGTRTGVVDTLFVAGEYSNVRVSSDGRRVLLEVLGSIATGDLSRGVVTPVDIDEDFARFPMWLEDGKSIAFSTLRDGSDPGHPLTTIADLESGRTLGHPDPHFTGWLLDWSEKHRVFVGEADMKLWVIPPDERSGGSTVLLESDGTESWQASFSPDGEFIAYSSKSKTSDIWDAYVIKYPEKTPRYRVSNNGGIEPLWAPDGRTIYYRDSSGKKVYFSRFDPDTGPTGLPEVLTEGEFARGMANSTWDISADGQFFYAVVAPPRPPPPDRISLLFNWRPVSGR